MGLRQDFNIIFKLFYGNICVFLATNWKSLKTEFGKLVLRFLSNRSDPGLGTEYGSAVSERISAKMRRYEYDRPQH
jgi:hypothetical protein